MDVKRAGIFTPPRIGLLSISMVNRYGLSMWMLITAWPLYK